MPSFKYTGTLKTGSKTSGQIDSDDRKSAIRMLRRQGVTPIRVTESVAKRPKANSPKTKTQPKTNPESKQTSFVAKGTEVLGLKFAQRLLELHSGGLSLGDSVMLLSQRLSEPKLKAIANSVWNSLREGKSFARATESVKNLYPPAMSPLFEAGEASGEMIAVLKNTVTYIEERRALKSKIAGNLAYPIVLMGLVILIMVLFTYFLVPRIQSMIQSMGGEMNIFTKLLIGVSDAFLTYGPFAAVGLGLGLVLLSQWRRTETGRMAVDTWVLKIPVVGKILEASNMYQLSNLMTTLMESGINTSENLKLSERTIQNMNLKARFAQARTMVIEGASFSAAFKQHQLYEDSAIDILTVGENTGHLERGLKEITGSVRRLLDEKLKFLTVLISSGAMALAFFMVTFAALGMVLSVLEVSKTISLQ